MYANLFCKIFFYINWYMNGSLNNGGNSNIFMQHLQAKKYPLKMAFPLSFCLKLESLCKVQDIKLN